MRSDPLRGVVFDLDGLMFNTEDLYLAVGSEILRRRGKVFDQALRDQMMGRPGSAALKIMIDRHLLDDTVEGIAAESEEVFAALLDDGLATMPGLAALLDALESADIPKGIATSSGRRFTRNVLGRFQLEPRFRFVLTAEDVQHGKPDPEIYLRAARRLGIAPAEMLVLEDSENGCRAAVAAGAFTVAVPSRHSTGHDFSTATLVADTLQDRRIYDVLGI